MASMSNPQRPQRREIPVYPVPWLESTFVNRERTEELLRPELENGTITQRDFEMARNFYSGNHRLYSLMYGLGASTAAVVYGSTRKPVWPLARTSTLGAFLAFGGVMYGTARRFGAHKTFVDTLEDRPGFFRALEHVNARTGGTAVLGLPTEPTRPTDSGAQEAGDASERWHEGATAVIPAAQPDDDSTRQSAPLSTPSSRWNEIRAEHSRNGKQTAWDRVRTSRGRAYPITPVQAPSGTDFAPDVDSDQAKFDAMLEAERRKAEGAQTEKVWGS